MFGALTDKLKDIVGNLTRQRKLSENNISDAVRGVRMALLEADVNYGVAKTLVKRLKEKAVGNAVLKAVDPSQQFIKIVHDELVALMGGAEEKLQLNGNPSVIMVCGLQGAGKTTHCAKLARFLQKQGQCENPLLAACDLQRPAAIEQLQTLGKQANIPVFSPDGEKNPVKVAKQALKKAKQDGRDLVIVDTAGRLHIDDVLMNELAQLKKAVDPHEILFVANATTGQDAVNTAAEFNSRVEITGTILTMLDGNTRGGSAISIREVTGKPLKFEGIGEKLDDIQPFSPPSMADRILGMGDTINLVRKAEEHFKEEESKELEQKIRKATFTYEDYLQQMQSIKKMGPINKLLGMLPGMNHLTDSEEPLENLNKIESMILSMTSKERKEECELIPRRRKRLANGSGRSIDEVNKLVKSFKQMKQMMKKMPNPKQLEKMKEGPFPW